jgi:hypothetical protein
MRRPRRRDYGLIVGTVGDANPEFGIGGVPRVPQNVRNLFGYQRSMVDLYEPSATTVDLVVGNLSSTTSRFLHLRNSWELTR